MLDPLVAKPERPVRALVPADDTPRHASAAQGCPPILESERLARPMGRTGEGLEQPLPDARLSLEEAGVMRSPARRCASYC